MKHIGKVLSYVVLSINILFAGLFLLCAYSPYANPEAYPLFSCFGLVFPVFLIINSCFFFFWLLVRWKFALVSFLAFILCAGQIRNYIPFNLRTEIIPENSFKLLSYNVMAFDLNQKHTEDKPNPIVEYLQKSDADIICLQEFIMGKDKHHLRKQDVDKALKSYPYNIYLAVGNETNGLACYSRYPILSAKQIKYDSKYNGSVIYKLNIEGDTVTLINNHLESNKLTYEDKAVYKDMIRDPNKDKVSSGMRLLLSKLAEASAIRAKQADTIATIIKECGNSSVIICGDFNDSPISYTHKVIARDVDDAFVQSGKGLGISYHESNFYFRIDNILISRNLESFNCTVDRSISDSDHYPMWCYIKKRDE